jgi:hypothetical protein
MAYALVQSRKSVSNSANSTALSFTSLPTVGRLIVVAVATYAGNIGTSAVSDNQGNSYTRSAVAQPDGQDSDAALFWAIATTSAGTFTVTVNPDGTSADITFIIAEFSGNASSPADQATNSPTNAQSTSATSGNITPSEANCLWVGVLTHCGTNRTITETNGTRIDEDEGGTSNMPISMTYKVQTAAATEAATWTIGTGSVYYGAVVASFKAAAAAAFALHSLSMTGCGK